MLEYISSLKSRQKLLLHSCCAPCSSYCLSQLVPFFDVTVYFFNPNVTCCNEYQKRLAEQRRLIDIFNGQGSGIELIVGEYDVACYFDAVSGLEKMAEGGARCQKCFALRLESTAKTAKESGFDIFATTLTVSPHKNSLLINEIGQKLQQQLNIKYLPSDFKKREGYKQSIELSAKYNLYRQNYCGCLFSKNFSEVNV